jgi:RNA polymerase sigma-70 factor (ECF subfamily)
MTAGGVQPGLPADGPDLSPGSPPGPLPGSLVQVRAEWTDFYDTHYHRVVRFVILNGATRAQAEDAAQEAFLESWDLLVKDPDRWQAVTGKAAWIRTVALRRHRRPPGPRRSPLIAGTELPDRPADSPGLDVLTVETQFVLWALQALDEEARTVMAFDMDGIPAADTAVTLGITQQRVRDVRKKARAALKKLLAGTTTPGRRQP